MLCPAQASLSHESQKALLLVASPAPKLLMLLAAWYHRASAVCPSAAAADAAAVTAVAAAASSPPDDRDPAEMRAERLLGVADVAAAQIRHASAPAWAGLSEMPRPQCGCLKTCQGRPVSKVENGRASGRRCGGAGMALPAWHCKHGIASIASKPAWHIASMALQRSPVVVQRIELRASHN